MSGNSMMVLQCPPLLTPKKRLLPRCHMLWFIAIIAKRKFVEVSINF